MDISKAITLLEESMNKSYCQVLDVDVAEAVLEYAKYSAPDYSGTIWDKGEKVSFETYFFNEKSFVIFYEEEYMLESV